MISRYGGRRNYIYKLNLLFFADIVEKTDWSDWLAQLFLFCLHFVSSCLFLKWFANDPVIHHVSKKAYSIYIILCRCNTQIYFVVVLYVTYDPSIAALLCCKKNNHMFTDHICQTLLYSICTVEMVKISKIVPQKIMGKSTWI